MNNRLTISLVAASLLVSGAALETVTLIDAEVVVFPAASLATAVSECVPLDTPVVLHVTP